MKTLYSNGIGTSVQVNNENKKGARPVGTAEMAEIMNAKKEGNVRIFKMHNGNKVGVSEKVWDEFMAIHDDEQTRLRVELESIPFSWLRSA